MPELPDEKIIERMRKLHRMAESARAIGSTAEAEAFAEAVARMQIKYQLESLDLSEELREPDGDMGWVTANFVPEVRKRLPWLEGMAMVVANFYGVQTICHYGTSRVTFVGHEVPRKQAMYVLGKLTRMATDLAEAHVTLVRRVRRGNPQQFRRAFLLGFSHAIYSRLRRVDDTEGTKALVVWRDARLAAALDFYRKDHKLTTDKSRMSHQTEERGSYRAGTEAGMGADVSANGLDAPKDRQRMLR